MRVKFFEAKDVEKMETAINLWLENEGKDVLIHRICQSESLNAAVGSHWSINVSVWYEDVKIK
jgi:hypothetical protein